MKKTTFAFIFALSIGSALLTKISFAADGEVTKAGQSLLVDAESYYDVLIQERTRILNDQTTLACLNDSETHLFSDPCAEALVSIRAYANFLVKALRVMSEKTDAVLVAAGSLQREIYRADPASPLLIKIKLESGEILKELNFFRDAATLIDFMIYVSSRQSKSHDAQRSEVANWTSGDNSEVVASDLEYIKSFVKTSR